MDAVEHLGAGAARRGSVLIGVTCETTRTVCPETVPAETVFDAADPSATAAKLHRRRQSHIAEPFAVQLRVAGGGFEKRRPPTDRSPFPSARRRPPTSRPFTSATACAVASARPASGDETIAEMDVSTPRRLPAAAAWVRPRSVSSGLPRPGSVAPPTAPSARAATTRAASGACRCPLPGRWDGFCSPSP